MTSNEGFSVVAPTCPVKARDGGAGNDLARLLDSRNVRITKRHSGARDPGRMKLLKAIIRHDDSGSVICGNAYDARRKPGSWGIRQGTRAPAGRRHGVAKAADSGAHLSGRRPNTGGCRRENHWPARTFRTPRRRALNVGRSRRRLRQGGPVAADPHARDEVGGIVR